MTYIHPTNNAFNMKRKRPNRSTTCASKRQKTEISSILQPSHALLQKYYPQVVSLRQYLASRLSKKRRRRLQQYGRENGEEAVCQLLDTTLVGAFGHVQIDDSSFIEEDLTIYTQQRTQSDSFIGLTPGSFQQPEVGRWTLTPLFSSICTTLDFVSREYA